MQRRLVVPAGETGRLDVWLTSVLARPRHQVQSLLRAGAVKLNGEPARASYRLSGREKVVVVEPKAPVPPPAPDIPVVYEDAEILVVNKPAGLVVHPGHGRVEATLADFARAHTTDRDPERPGIVHRLDRDTSGLLVIARTAASKRRLQEAFKSHQVTKTYLVLVTGHLRPDQAVVRLPLGRAAADPRRRVVRADGKSAETTYRVLEEFNGYSLVEAQPLTGRTHQLRAHFAALGHPIAGDRPYGAPAPPAGLKRQFLHAAALELPLPGGRRKSWKVPLPPDLDEVLTRLRRSVY